MITKSADEFLNESQNVGIKSDFLDVDESKRLLRNLSSEFCEGRRFHWENLTNSVSSHDVDGWKLLDEFIGNEQYLILFDQEEDQRVVACPANFSCVKILSECTGFEFYVTNKECNYLVCFNHHDILIASGNAENVLTKLKGMC